MNQAQIIDALAVLSEATWDAARFIRYAERAIDPDAPAKGSIAAPILRVEASMRQRLRVERAKVKRATMPTSPPAK